VAPPSESSHDTEYLPDCRGGEFCRPAQVEPLSERNGALLSPGESKTPGRSGIRTGLVALSRADDITLTAWKLEGELSWQLYNAQGVAQGAVQSVPSAGKGAAVELKFAAARSLQKPTRNPLICKERG
jgi:hypothetical protein